jgi:PAS domain S-box-containing protein
MAGGDTKMNCSLGALEAIHFRVVEASPDAKIVINEQGEIIVFNQQAELLFGYDRTEVLGKDLRVLLPAALHAAHEKHIKRFFAHPQTREMGTGQVLLGVDRNGREFHVQIKLAPIVVPGAGKHCLAVVRAVDEPEEADDGRNPVG